MLSEQKWWLQKNINISKGAINGGIVIMTFLTFNVNKIITSITIKVLCTNIYLTLSRWTLQYKYTYEACYYKTSFPIVLTYVITVHKTQGPTITCKVPCPC